MFQSTHPAWGVTALPGDNFEINLFQSTHPAWGVTLYQQIHPCAADVSIHTPRVGCDETVLDEPNKL